MALRDPELGDTEIIQLRDAVVAYVRAAFKPTAVHEVVKYRGPITLETIKQYSVKAPAVVVSIEGTEDAASTGSAVQVPVMLTAAVITKARTDGDADDPCAAITLKLIRLVTDNKFSLDFADAAQAPASRNLYTGKIGAQDINVWVVKWPQTITVNKMTEAEYADLENLLRIHATYTRADDAPDHQHRTTFEDA